MNYFGFNCYLSVFLLFFLQYFQKELPSKAEADPEGLMQLAYSMKYNAKKMKKLEKEYSVIKAKEQEEMVELKVFVIICFLLP